MGGSYILGVKPYEWMRMLGNLRYYSNTIKL